MVQWGLVAGRDWRMRRVDCSGCWIPYRSKAERREITTRTYLLWSYWCLPSYAPSSCRGVKRRSFYVCDVFDIGKWDVSWEISIGRWRSCCLLSDTAGYLNWPYNSCGNRNRWVKSGGKLTLEGSRDSDLTWAWRFPDIISVAIWMLPRTMQLYLAFYCNSN